MAGKAFGIEIGNDTVKIAVYTGGIVTNMLLKRLPEGLMRDGVPTNAAALTEFLQVMCKEAHLRPGRCGLVLPSSAIIAHRVRLPVMSPNELTLNLPFEFRDFVGKDAAKYYYDYSVLDTQGNTMELYAAAVPIDVVEQYDSILRKAGFSMLVATPPEMAWLNLIRSTEGEPNKLCIVDIGHKNTCVSIYADNKYEMGRNIELGSGELDRIIAENLSIDLFAARARKDSNLDNILAAGYCTDTYAELAIEVMRVVNYYQVGASNGAPLRDIYYCGGGALVESLRIAIMKRTELTMHHIRRLVKCADTIEDDMVARCALAAGAGIQAL